MRTTFPVLLRRYGADGGMIIMVVIWGLHYIVVKDAIAMLPPLAFNAIRFSLGLPVLLLFGLRHRSALRVGREDSVRLVLLGLLGPFGYQIFFIHALDLTTSTNTALLNSTMPTWIAVLSLALGIVLVRRQLILGVVMSLAGVVLVIMGGSANGLAVSSQDLMGSGLALCAALVTALYTLWVKALIDRWGGLAIALWTYLITWIGLLIAAAPDLANLTASDLAPRIWPHLFFSGVMSCAFGFLIENYALRVLGPARISPYYNISPIVAALGGVLIMGDPLTVSIALGGALTLWGVIVVRRNTLLRIERRPQTALDSVPDGVPDGGTHPAPAPQPEYSA